MIMKYLSGCDQKGWLNSLNAIERSFWFSLLFTSWKEKESSVPQFTALETLKAVVNYTVPRIGIDEDRYEAKMANVSNQWQKCL